MCPYILAQTMHILNPIFINKHKALLNLVFMLHAFSICHSDRQTHDPPAFAGIQLEVKEVRNITLLNAATISLQVG